jgi:hypothetical protein
LLAFLIKGIQDLAFSGLTGNGFKVRCVVHVLHLGRCRCGSAWASVLVISQGMNFSSAEEKKTPHQWSQ